MIVAALALAACKGKSQDAVPSAGSAAGSAVSAEAPRAHAPMAKIEGPSVSPVVTRAVTFVTPKDAAWWGELNFACYRAVIGLSGTSRPGDAFEKLSPNVVPAMSAGGIDLGRDLAGIGAFDCSGSPCFYVAAHLDHPEKMAEVLRLLVPASQPKDLGKGHYQLATPGVSGPRTINVRVVPIQWGEDLPVDPWSQQAARATHVVFIGGIDGKNVDQDPLTHLADAPTAAAYVKDAEAVLEDASGRCLIGVVGSREFQPGFRLQQARFALAAPEGHREPLMQLLGSTRTVDVEVELALAPAPKPADVERWISMGRGYASGLGAQLRGQFAGQGAMMDVYFDMVTLLATTGFRHEIAGDALHLSWRTDRVPKADLDDLERRLEAAVKTP